MLIILIPIQIQSTNNNSIILYVKAESTIKASQDIESQVFDRQNLIDNEMENYITLLTQIIKNKINEAITILEITSNQSIVKGIPFEKNISKEFKGIAEYLDVKKREIAKDIMKLDNDIGSIYFVLPNGDIYLGEPYKDQKQLPRLNFADRDWFKGVSTLNRTYVSSVFTSASIHVPATAIAVPVYSDTNNSLLGYWVGIINLENIDKQIQSLHDKNNTYFIVLDHHGKALINSKNNFTNLLVNDTDLQNFSNTYTHDNNTLNSPSYKSSKGLFNNTLDTNEKNLHISMQPITDIQFDKIILKNIKIDGIQKHIAAYYPFNIGNHTWTSILLYNE